jgi:hypothetical protein
MRSHNQGRASNPAFVSSGSSSCISIKFIDFSISKWDEGHFPAFGPVAPEGPTQVDYFSKVKTIKRFALVGDSGKSLVVLRMPK